MDHLPEVLKIIEGGIKSNHLQVQSYAKLLAEKLDKDGLSRAAQSVRKKLDAIQNEGYATSHLSTITLPVDRDSRLALGDESFPKLQEKFIKLPTQIKNTLDEFLGFIDKAELLAEAGVGISPSMLLYGPPGCGKTQLANHIAAQLELPLITARCDTLISSFLGSTSKNLRSLFDHASSRPCVLFLDEFDAFAKARDDQHELGELKRVVVSLLQNIDTLPDTTILIAATNHEGLLDAAVWRRFNYKIRVPLPDHSVRQDLIHLFLGDFCPPSIKLLVDITDGFSGAVIEQSCKTAVRSAVIKGEKQVDIDSLILNFILEQYQGVLNSNLSIEDQAHKLRKLNPKIFTLQRLSNLLGISTGKLSKIFASNEQ